MARTAYLVAIGAMITLLSGAGFAAELASHRALYLMTLHFARSGSGISSVTGKMAVEWARTCAGWTFEHQSLIDVSFNTRDPVRLSTNATSWESLDGRQYRFSIRNLTNGKVTERVEGVAQLVAGGGPGRVTFTAPKPRTEKLPAGIGAKLATSIATSRGWAGTSSGAISSGVWTERTKSRETVKTKSARFVYMLVRKSCTISIVISGRLSHKGGPQSLKLF